MLVQTNLIWYCAANNIIRTGGLFPFCYVEVHGAGEMAIGAMNGADKGKPAGLLVIIAESSPTSKATSGLLG